MVDPVFIDKENYATYKGTVDTQDLNEHANNNRFEAQYLMIPMYGMWLYKFSDTQIEITRGFVNINGIPRYNTSSIIITYTTPTNGHYLDVWAGADVDGPNCTFEAVTSGSAVPGGSSTPYTNGQMIGSILYVDNTTYLSNWQSYRGDYICGWDWIAGNNSLDLSLGTVNFPTFSELPIIKANPFCRKDNKPESIGNEHDNSVTDPWSGEYSHIGIRNITKTSFEWRGRMASNFLSNKYYMISWIAKGPHRVS